MAKPVYGIPATLDQSMADMEITLQTKDGVGAHPIPIKIVLAYVVSGIACFYFVSNTFIADGGIWRIPFVVLWILLTMFLLRVDDTKQPQYQLVRTFFDYLPSRARRVRCKPTDNARDFMGLVGVWDVEPGTGRITFVDGTLGYGFMVTGSASVLLFSQDQEAIIDRVDSFFRKIHEDAEYVFVTTKESQKVYRQLEAEVARFKLLPKEEDPDFDPDLASLADTRFRCLRDFVGGEFRSIHQYLFIKAENAEALEQAKNILRGEVEGSNLMFKRCVALDEQDIAEVFGTIYRGKESV